MTAIVTFAALAATVPLGERTLRKVLAELGLRRPAGRGRLVFTPDQVRRVREAVACRSACSLPAPAKATAISSPRAGEKHGANKIIEIGA